jgi:putative transcriptional regulator
MSEYLSGRLLIAGPSLGDPNFDRTIVYLLEHSEDGALGVVLNRPSAFDVVDALPLWSTATGRPHVVFSGGPVDAGVALGLARVRTPIDCPGWSAVHGAIGSVDLAMDPEAIAAGIEVARVFVGYAGWGAGQLDEEVEGGAWFVIDCGPDDVFTSEPEQLWGAILRRDESRAAMTATNPSWN